VTSKWSSINNQDTSMFIKKIISKITYFISVILSSSEEMPTRFWAGFFAITWVVIIVIFFFIRENLITLPFPSIIDYIAISFAFFIGGLSGVVCIINREFPIFLIIIRGKVAVIIGLLILMLSWSFCFYLLYLCSKLFDA